MELRGWVIYLLLVLPGLCMLGFAIVDELIKQLRRRKEEALKAWRERNAADIWWDTKRETEDLEKLWKKS